MIHVKINGKTEYRGDASKYAATPPDLFKDAIRPGAKPAPWLKAIAVVFVEAAQRAEMARQTDQPIEDVDIIVTTGPKRWVMEVCAP